MYILHSQANDGKNVRMIVKRQFYEWEEFFSLENYHSGFHAWSGIEPLKLVGIT